LALWDGMHACSSACTLNRVNKNCDDEFVCAKSGLVHHCGLTHCNVQIQTPVGVQCRLTKLMLDKVIEQTALVVAKPLFEDHARRSEIKANEDREEIAAAHIRHAPEMVVQKSWAALDEIKDESKFQDHQSAWMRIRDETEALRQKNDPLDLHRCIPGVCKMKKLDELGDEIYMCTEYGRVHRCGKRCTARDDKTTETYVCAVTGLVLGDITAKPGYAELQHMRVHRIDGKKKKRKRKKSTKNGMTPGSKYVHVVSGIVNDLLFSETRRQYDIEHLERATAEGIKEVKVYCKHQRQEGKQIHTAVMEIVFMSAMRSYQGQARMNVEPDQEKCVYYAKRCLDFWRRINPNFDEGKIATNLRVHVVGFLYTQQRGLQHQGQVIVEPDSYLEKVGLPDESTLGVFEIPNGHFARILKTIRRHLTMTLKHKTIEQVRMISSTPEIDLDAEEKEEAVESDGDADEPEDYADP